MKLFKLYFLVLGRFEFDKLKQSYFFSDNLE